VYTPGSHANGGICKIGYVALCNQGKLKDVRTIQLAIMQSGGIVCIILFCSIFVAGCIELPGIHIISNTPDPIIGQWVGGEPPQSDLHLIFFENQTFLSRNFFLNRAEVTDTGNWTKINPGYYTTQSVTGEIKDWMYDSFEDSVYVRKLPQMKYYRYKG